MSKKAIYWFTNDLRLDDNRTLVESARHSDELAFIYIIDPGWFETGRFQSRAIGKHRLSFLIQSLIDLDRQLAAQEQSLQLYYGKPESVIDYLIENCCIDYLFRSVLADYDLNTLWQRLIHKHTQVKFKEFSTHTLFDRRALPFDVSQLPATFTGFRKIMENQRVPDTIKQPGILPDLLRLPAAQNNLLNSLQSAQSSQFIGGSTQALAHLEDYFTNAVPHRYFETRNSLDGWDNSTKFSSWLANGSLSSRRIMTSLLNYESTVTKNKSTYWIYFELLWREYFQWYAHRYGSLLFSFSGIKQKKPLTSFYAERFKKWRIGNTPYAIVNACMNELNNTGYLSNRGRQIVASCFINELSLDWRYGASYFEQQLIDYDVASNWGNWQYLAGIGADPQPKRHFNLDRQVKKFDPTGKYINSWTNTDNRNPLDSVDASDWPISQCQNGY